MSVLSRSFLSAALGLFIVSAPAFGAWEQPKDGVVAEKQLVACLDIQKQALDNLKASGKALEGSQSGALALAAMMNNDAKFKASLAAHGMSQEEYNWVGGQIWQAWGGVIADKMVANSQKALAEQKKTNEQKVADLKKKLAQYEKAQAEGRRVMTKEERDQAIESAKGDRQSALDEAKQHAEELKQAQEDATKADNDAKAADALAKNPPADVTADDRPGYIDQKKTDAQQARDAAKEAREKAAEAKKLQDESNPKVAALDKQIADVDLPVSDEDKAEVKKANEEEIASLKTDIAEGEKGIQLLDESGQTFARSMQEQRAKDPIPQQNIDLLKKHQADFEKVWGVGTDVR